MEAVHTDAEEGIKACSCSLEEPSITKSLLVLYDSLHLYFFFNFKSKVNYQDTEAFLSHTFHIIKVFWNDSDF